MISVKKMQWKYHILNKVNVRKGRLAVDNHTVEKDTVPRKCIITVDEEMIG